MKIICVGRNYAEHAIELNNPIPTEPLLFMKPSTSLLVNDKPFYYPEFSQDVHYEGELVLKVCKNGRHIQKEFAHNYYNQISIGIDFTARDIQKVCKKKGHPWEIAKAFDQSAPVGKFIAYPDHMDSIQFTLKKNGSVIQRGDTNDLIFGFDILLSYISQRFTLHTGDLIFTGTPAGVGPVQIGDIFEGYIGEEYLLRCEIK